MLTGVSCPEIDEEGTVHSARAATIQTNCFFTLSPLQRERVRHCLKVTEITNFAWIETGPFCCGGEMSARIVSGRLSKVRFLQILHEGPPCVPAARATAAVLFR